MEERRVHPRLPVPLETTVLLDGAEIEATMEDLSAGGAGLYLRQEIDIGTKIEVSFVLPGDQDVAGREITTWAKVVRMIPGQEDAGQGGFRAGVQFLDLQEVWHKKIQQFIFYTLTKGRPQLDEIPLERRRVTLRRPVSVRFDRFDEFVGEISENLSASGMFIRTNAPKPPGTVFSFAFQLGDDFSLVEGRAEVVWTRRKTIDRERPAGMGVRFFDMDDRSRNTILSLIAKAAEGKSETGSGAEKVRVAPATPNVPAAPAPVPASLPAREDLEWKTDSESPANGDEAKAESLRTELARRTKAYEGRIGALEERIAELTASQVDGDTERRQSDSSAAELQALNDLLEKRLAEVQSLHESQSHELREQVEAADKELVEWREAARVHKEEAANNRRGTSGLENRLLAVEQALRHAESERDEQSSRARESTRIRHDLEAKIETLEASDKASEQEELRSKLDEATNRGLVLEDRLSESESERENLAEKVSKLSSVEDSYRLVAEGAEAKREELQKALDAATLELARLLEEKEIETTGLRQAIKEAESGRQKLEQDLGQMRDEFETSQQRESADALSIRTALEEQTAQLEASVENEVRARHAAEEAQRQAENELDRSQGEHEELESGLRLEALTAVAAVAGAKSSLGDLEGSFAESERERQRLEADLEAVREELETLRESGVEVENELRVKAEEAVAAADELRSQLASLEIDLEDAETSQQDLTNQIESLKNRGLKAEESATSTHAELEKLRGESESRISDLEEELTRTLESDAGHEAEISHLEASLEEAQGEASRLEETLRAELEEAYKDAATVKSELKNLATTESQARDEIDELREASESRINALESRLAEAEEAGWEQGKKVSHLEASLEEAQGEASRLEETLRAELEEAYKDAATVKSELKNLATTESLARDEIDKLREASESQISALENRLAEAEEAGGEKGKKVSHLEALLSDGEQERQEAEEGLRAELEQARTAADTLQRDLDSAHAQLVDYKEQAGETEGRLSLELEESGETVRSLRDRIEALESAAQEAAREAGEREDLMTVGLDPAEGDDEALRGEVTTLRATVDRLNAEIEGQAPEYGEAAAPTLEPEERAGRRWLPATGLMAAGLIVGVLAAGPVARLLPSGSANWFGDKSSPASVSGAEAEVADASLASPTSSRGEELGATAMTPVATEAGLDSTDGPAVEVAEPSLPPAGDAARAWAAAWSDQRIDDYLSHYSRDFRPPNGAGRRAWESYRRERVAAPDSIEVTLTEVTETALDDAQVEVVFVQTYSAGAYSDKVHKTLLMKREDGAWKILSEASEAL